MNIKALHIYPIKSLGGISVNEIECTPRGMAMDRRYMLVDKDFQFLSQRTHAALALFSVRMEAEQLIITFNQQLDDELTFSIHQVGDYLSKNVTIWSSSVKAKSVSEKVDLWFSKKLGQPCQLVYMPEETKRMVDPIYGPDEIVSFADGYPFLLTNSKSLEDLNSKMDAVVDMNRFRTNIEVEGNLAFEEDNWKEIKVGQQIFTVSKPCSRCLMTNINPNDATASPHVLKTLSTYRNKNNKVLFGINLCWKSKENGDCVLRVGDEVVVEERSS